MKASSISTSNNNRQGSRSPNLHTGAGTGVQSNAPRAATMGSADITREGRALLAWTPPAPEVFNDNDAPVTLELQQLANEDDEVFDDNDAPVPLSLDSSSGQSTRPWWKRNSFKFFIASLVLLIGALMATARAKLGQRGNSSAAAPVTDTTTSLITTTTSTIAQPADSVATSTIQEDLFDGDSSLRSTTTTTAATADAISTARTFPAPPIMTTTTEVTTTTTTAADTTTTQKCVENVHFLQTLFKEDWDCSTDDCDDCFLVFAIDGDTAVATKDFESLQFFSINNGNFELETTIPIDYDVGDISLFGDVAVVGAPLEDGKTGAVYVYERLPLGEWGQTMRIVPSDIVGDSLFGWSDFGWSVSLSEDVFVVGAPWADEAYIYRRSGSTWELETKLIPEGATLGYYGRSVSIVGNVVAVGDDRGRGKVFVFHFDSTTNSWNQLGERIANDDCSGWFGLDVALTSDNGLLIGCWDESTLSKAGAVYYYQQSEGDGEFVFRQKIMASDAADWEYFGVRNNRIAVDWDVMVVGTQIETSGKAYIFTRVGNEWNEVSIINAPAGNGPYFGYRVAISQNKILVYSDTNVYTYGFDIENC